MLDPPYGLWSIWPNISYLYRSIVVMLAAVSIYSLFSTVRNFYRLHAVWKIQNNNIATRGAVAAAIRSQSNVGKLIGAVFYLFGVVLFLGLQTVGQTFGDGNFSLGRFVVGNLVLHFAFAANIFFIFLVLHLFHWSALAILNSLPARIEKRDSMEADSTLTEK